MTLPTHKISIGLLGTLAGILLSPAVSLAQDSIGEEQLPDLASESTLIIAEPEGTDPTQTPESAPVTEASDEIELKRDANLSQESESNSISVADKNTPASAFQILSPENDSHSGGNTADIKIKVPVGVDVELRLNGDVVDDGLIGQTFSNPADRSIQHTWFEIDLPKDFNVITLHERGNDEFLDRVYVNRGVKSSNDVAAITEVSRDPGIIFPQANQIIDQPATSITVQAPTDEAIELRVNGNVVDSGLIGKIETNPEFKLTRTTWYGVILASGTNEIALYIADSSEPLEVFEVQVRGEPTQIKVTTLESNIPADGRSVATVKGQLLDSNKNKSDWTATVTLNATKGEFIGVDLNPEVPGFQVKAENGQFTATLQSDIQSGIARIQALSNELEGYHELEYVTPLRETPLLTGSVSFRFGRRGTDFFDRLENFLPVDDDDSFQADIKGAAFGTASVGEWLFTGAFNTDRALNTDCNGETNLFKASSDCADVDYSVYGDESQVDFFAPSQDNGFLKIERTSPVTGAGSDYFLWGDYNTQELSRASQRFSGIARDLHGFKGNFNVGRFQLTGIYGNNVDGFQRDTIAPDGTSGFYFLSRQLLLSGSEEIFFETEELNRPGTVIERVRLNRGVDYEIDYDRGTLLFNDPVFRTDVDDNGTVLVRRIVATYQFESVGDRTDVFGGRVQYNLSRKRGAQSWLGATYFQENRGDQDFRLFGADAQISFGQDGLIIAEYARSENSIDGVDRLVDGEAINAEISSTLFGNVKGRGYFSTTDQGFSNNAATSFVPGQTRYGAELDAEIGKTTSLRASFDHEDNFGVSPQELTLLEDLITPGLTPRLGAPIDNRLTTIKAGIAQSIGKAEVTLDYVRRDREDGVTLDSVISDQIRSSVKVPVNKRLSINATNEVNISSESDPLFPNRTTLGLDYEIFDGLGLTLDNTYFDGGQFDGDLITSLGLKAQHKFKTDTALKGELTTLGDGLSAQGLGGRFGIDQGFKLAKGLTADVGYEFTFSQLFQTAAGDQFEQPFAVGTGASALSVTGGHSFNVALDYSRNSDLQLGAVVQHRTNDRGSNTVISTNALGKLSRDVTGLLSYRQASAANQTLEGLGVTREVKVGLAYRNLTNDKFNGLLRYEYDKNPSIIPETLLLGTGTGSESHLFSAEGVYAPHWRWEIYGKAGVRFSRTQLADNVISSSTTPIGLARITHRLNYQWDVAAEARYIAQPSAGFDEFGFNAEVGFYVNPNIRFSAGYAFGEVNDNDLGNSRSRSGPYVGFNVKLDNNLFKDFGFQDPHRPRPPEPEGEAPAPEAAAPAAAVLEAPKVPVSTESEDSPLEQETISEVELQPSELDEFNFSSKASDLNSAIAADLETKGAAEDLEKAKENIILTAPPVKPENIELNSSVVAPQDAQEKKSIMQKQR